jgi:hypothetical protein
MFLLACDQVFILFQEAANFCFYIIHTTCTFFGLTQQQCFNTRLLILIRIEISCKEKEIDVFSIKYVG